MKIIENSLDKTWRDEVLCRKCQSRLEIDEADVKYYSSRDQREESYFYFKCPVCNNSYNRLQHLPFHVQFKARGF